MTTTRLHLARWLTLALVLAWPASAWLQTAAPPACALVLMHGKWGGPQSLAVFANKVEPTCHVVPLEMPWSGRRAYDQPYPVALKEISARVQALRRGTGGVELPQSAARSLLVVVLEPLLAAVAALALVGLGGWQGGLGLAALLPLGLLNPRWLEPLLGRLERRKARDLAAELGGELDDPESVALAACATPAPLPGYPWPPLLAELAFVLLRFAGFACCVWAFDLQLSLPWTTWLSGFALAWTVGLVVPGAPGGLGVFEAVLLLRLGGGLAAAPLLAVALSYRLVATLGDVLASLLADLDGRLARGGPGLPSQ
jgi:hypothetical protein